MPLLQSELEQLNAMANKVMQEEQMLDSILNKIAERSQALKDKDAEIKALKEVGESWESRNAELLVTVDKQDARIKEVTDSRERAYDALREANRSVEEAESKFLKIATALDIEVVDGEVMAPDAPAEEPAAEKEAEAPATEG